MLIPLPQLFRFTDIGPGWSKPGIAYPEAASVVKYLVERYGFEKFILAYRSLKRSSDDQDIATNRAKFTEIFGIGLEEVEKSWLESLKAATLEAVPKPRLDELRLKYGPAAGTR